MECGWQVPRVTLPPQGANLMGPSAQTQVLPDKDPTSLGDRNQDAGSFLG